MKRFSIIEEKGLKFAGIFDKEDLASVYYPNFSLHLKDIVKLKLAEKGFHPAQIIKVRQVHSNIVLVIDSSESFCVEDWSQIVADGIITNLENFALVISVADCVPVFLLDVRNKVLGLLHAGREGTRRKILPTALNLLYEKFHSFPEDIYVLIGPSIGPCCYIVSEELAKQCGENGLIVEDGNRVNLWESNIVQAQNMKVPSSNIILTGECTCCSDKYYSYRRGALYERNIVVGII